MRKSADNLRADLTEAITALLSNPGKRQNIAKQGHGQFDIPIGLIGDYLTLRKSLTDANDFILYILTFCIIPDHLEKYFTKSELKTYSESKYKQQIVSFPIVLPMIEVNSGTQWIGTVSVKDLMRLKEAQMIAYNENTQRTMRRMIAGDQEYYQIFLNDNAVEGIMKSFSTGTYISNTITLNLGENADFTYDSAKKELKIASLKSFDILDGYHRYIAMSKLSILNPEFDYKMELRILNFNEADANQFIWQEDQKTKMRKVDSDFHNQYDPANKVVNTLSKDSVLSGQISINQGMVNAGDLAKAIKAVYFSEGITKTNTLKRTIEVTKDLREKLSSCVEENPDILDKPWKAAYIFGFITACKLYEDPKDILDAADFIYRDKAFFDIPKIPMTRALYQKAKEKLEGR